MPTRPSPSPRTLTARRWTTCKTLPASIQFITEDGHGVQNNATMARAFAICTQRGITVMSHAEDLEITPGTTAWPRTSRRCATATWRVLQHPAAHVPCVHQGPSRPSAWPPARGPCHLRGDPPPPVVPRTPCDYRSTRPSARRRCGRPGEAIRTGIVDLPSAPTMHPTPPRTRSRAWPVWWAGDGLRRVLHQALPQEGLPLELLVYLMSTRPAEILGLAKGQLDPGYDADFVLVDLDTPLYGGQGQTPRQIPQLPL